MKKMLSLFSDSLKEFNNVTNLTIMAMLMALAIVLGFFSVQVTESIKIGFSFIPNMLVGLLFGPAATGIFGGVADLLKYIIKPTGPFFPGFTISSIVGGIIYGLVLYRKPIRYTRVLVANVLVTVFVNMIMNTYWLTLLYGNGFFVILPARIVKELIMLPITSILFFSIAKTLHTTVLKRTQFNFNKPEKKLS